MFEEAELHYTVRLPSCTKTLSYFVGALFWLIDFAFLSRRTVKHVRETKARHSRDRSPRNGVEPTAANGTPSHRERAS